jgi:hypothetical protein
VGVPPLSTHPSPSAGRSRRAFPSAAPIPEGVRSLLLRARLAESTTEGGAARRDAYRAMRHVLGATLEAGYPVAGIAAILGVRADSIRSRSQPGGLLSTEAALWLTGLTPADLRRSSIRLAHDPDRPTVDFHPAIDIVRHVADNGIPDDVPAETRT